MRSDAVLSPSGDVRRTCKVCTKPSSLRPLERDPSSPQPTLQSTTPSGYEAHLPARHPSAERNFLLNLGDEGGTPGGSLSTLTRSRRGRPNGCQEAVLHTRTAVFTFFSYSMRGIIVHILPNLDIIPLPVIERRPPKERLTLDAK